MTEQACIRIALVKSNDYNGFTSVDLKVLIVKLAIEQLAAGIYKDGELLPFVDDIVSVAGLVSVGAGGAISTDQAVITQKIDDFLAAPNGTLLPVDVYPSFIDVMDPWIHFATQMHANCRSSSDQIPSPPDGSDLGKCLILQTLSKQQRIAWALARIEEQRQADADANSRGQPRSERRYEPGRSYGPLYFICHPYPGFPNDGIWLSPDGHLYWVNERDLSLEALCEAATKAEQMVAIELALTAVLASVAGGVAVIDGAIGTSKALFSWALATPTHSVPLGIIGAEIVLSAAAGADMGPVSAADSIVAVIQAESAVTLRVLGEVEQVATAEGRVVIRALEAEIVTKSLASTPKAPRALYRIGTIAAARAAEVAKDFVEPLTNQELAQFDRNLISLAERQLAAKGKARDTASRALGFLTGKRAQDTALRKGFATFGHLPEFTGVLANAASRTRNIQTGARFQISAALHAVEIIGDAKPGDLMGFEFNQVFGYLEAGESKSQVVRRMDFWLKGWRFEMKSVHDIQARLATGSASAETGLAMFGQLERDLILSIGSDGTGGLGRLARLRWYFDSVPLLGKNASPEAKAKAAKEIADRLFQLISQEGRIFHNWPRLDEIGKAMTTIIEVI